MTVDCFAALMSSFHMQFPTNTADWEQIILRWTHFAAGITWIGLLYFFNLVNVPFQKEMDSPTRAKVVPLMMPRALWWFRWSAVVTVLATCPFSSLTSLLEKRSHE